MPTPLLRMTAELHRDAECYYWCLHAPNGHPMMWTKCCTSASNARRGLRRTLTSLRVEGVDVVEDEVRTGSARSTNRGVT
jgi:hypothetical protein